MKGSIVSIVCFLVVTCSSLSLEKIPPVQDVEATTLLPSVDYTEIKESPTDQVGSAIEDTQTEMPFLLSASHANEDEPMKNLLPELSTSYFAKFSTHEGICEPDADAFFEDNWSQEACTEKIESETKFPEKRETPEFNVDTTGSNIMKIVDKIAMLRIDSENSMMNTADEYVADENQIEDFATMGEQTEEQAPVTGNVNYPLLIELDVRSSKSHSNTKRQTDELSPVPNPSSLPAPPPLPPMTLSPLESSEEKTEPSEGSFGPFTIFKTLRSGAQRVMGFPKKVMEGVQGRVKQVGDGVTKMRDNVRSMFNPNTTSQN